MHTILGSFTWNKISLHVPSEKEDNTDGGGVSRGSVNIGEFKNTSTTVIHSKFTWMSGLAHVEWEKKGEKMLYFSRDS